MRLKKNCNGCRAIDGTKCDIGYKTENIYYKSILLGCKPIEPCPKPKTYKEYFNLINQSQ